MKRMMYSCVAIMSLIGIIVYAFISAPKVIHVNQQFEATAYKVEDSSFAEKVSISLAGVFDEKSNSYLGKITINGKGFTNCRLDPAFAIVQCTEEGNERPPRDNLGMVFADKDFKTWSLRVDPSYLYTILNKDSITTSDIIISIPAEGRDSSLKTYNRLMNIWGDELEKRMK